MPGISFLCDVKGDLKNNEGAILHSLQDLVHYTHYKKRVLLKTDTYMLCATGYEEYPLTFFENDNFFLLLEGEIYGKNNNELKQELNALGQMSNDSANYAQIINWQLNTDGDFVILLLSKIKNEIILLNDALGHLPLYYHKTNNRIIISREARFVTNLMEDKRADNLAIAQYLLFGFSLGERTLLEDIFRLKPSSLVRIDLSRAQIEIDQTRQFNFDLKKYSDRNVKENANNLYALFNEACIKRRPQEEGYKNVLSLSGGLDSRAVAAGLYKNNIPFSGVTMHNVGQCVQKDEIVAQKVAEVFMVDWELITLPSPKGRDYLKLLKIKNGLNYLVMSDIICFLEQIRNKYGPKVALYTGDDGEIIKDFRPSRKLTSIDDLASYVLAVNSVFPLDAVAKLTSLSRSQIMTCIKDHLRAYPEESLDQKYIHFIICENIFNSGYEGIDRNRFYCRVLTPLWSVHFFNYAMSCPDDQKKYFGLYRELLSRFSLRAASIKYGNYGSPITSRRLPVFLFLSSRLPTSVRDRLRRMLGNPSSAHPIPLQLVQCLSSELQNCSSIGNYLSYASIQELITTVTKKEFLTLFTVTSALEDLFCNKSTIFEYCDVTFDND